MPRELPDRPEGRRCRVCGGTGQTLDSRHPERGVQICGNCGGQGRVGIPSPRGARRRQPQRSNARAAQFSGRPSTSEGVRQRLRDNKVREAIDAARVLEQAAASRPDQQQRVNALRNTVQAWGNSPTLTALQQASLQAQMISDAMPAPGDPMQNPVGEMLDILSELLGLTR